MSQLSALDFFAACLNNNNDMQVVPVFTRDGKFFERVKSGHRVEIGWSSSFIFGSVFSVKNREQSEREYLESLKFTIRWLPLNRGQDLEHQIRYHNLYYVVDGAEKLPKLKSSRHFFCGPFSFFPEGSLVQKEFRRLRAIEENEKKVQAGKDAAANLDILHGTGPFMPHPKINATA